MLKRSFSISGKVFSLPIWRMLIAIQLMSTRIPCLELMNQFIVKHPKIWNEDIGADEV